MLHPEKLDKTLTRADVRLVGEYIHRRLSRRRCGRGTYIAESAQSDAHCSDSATVQSIKRASNAALVCWGFSAADPELGGAVGDVVLHLCLCFSQAVRQGACLLTLY